MRLTSRSWKRFGITSLTRSATRTGGLDAGRSGADDDDVERALVDARRVVVGVLEDLEQPGPQRLGVVEGVEREGVLLGARACGRSSAATRRPARGSRRVNVWPSAVVTVRGRRVDGGHGELLDRRPSSSLAEDRAQRPGDVGGRQLGRRHLVQQRLELVVVVPVDQRDGDVVLRRAPWRSRRRRSRRRRSRPRVVWCPVRSSSGSLRHAAPIVRLNVAV